MSKSTVLFIISGTMFILLNWWGIDAALSTKVPFLAGGAFVLFEISLLILVFCAAIITIRRKW